MSCSTFVRTAPHRFGVVLTSFLQRPGLPFAGVLSEERIEAAFAKEGVSFGQAPEAIYTPALTLWAFLSQVLFEGEQRSCVAAVSRVVTLLAALGLRRPSHDTGAYCRARAKLSPPVLRRLACEVADGCEHAVPDEWLWHGRHVTLVDGTTVSMPDTEDNQAEYPQAKTQQEGLGFPIARLVVLLSLATAMVCDMAIGPYAGKETGETALLRELLDRLQPGEILLADRYYCSYFMIGLLLAKKVDVVFRAHQSRHTDFRRGKRLGKDDHVVEWSRPAKPEWMDQATYDHIPESISLREIRVRVSEPGFRTESFMVVTSLLDAEQYACAEVAQLYRRRWLVELDIRAIKDTLGMDVLRCKSPEMVRSEIWTCLLAYNLIRQSILNAASEAERSPRQLSFTAAMQKIAASWGTTPVIQESAAARVGQVHLKHMAKHVVGKRPDRIEPRAIKRRPKPHKLLTKPRAEAHAELLAGHA